jgi:hypothetical protein
MVTRGLTISISTRIAVLGKELNEVPVVVLDQKGPHSHFLIFKHAGRDPSFLQGCSYPIEILLRNEALNMQCPVAVDRPSTRQYRGIGELSYPFHDRTALVTNCGRICIFKKKINLSTSLAGQAVGLKEVDERIWLVSFMDYDLGYIDLEEKTLQPLDNPFGPKV